MSYILYKTHTLFIMPLGITLVGLLIGVILFIKGKRNNGIIVTISMIIWLWVWSTPGWADFIKCNLEHRYRFQPADSYPVADAIVILGGGIRGKAGKDLPMLDLEASSDRELFGAELYHAGKAKTIIVSSGIDPIKGTGIAGLSMKSFQMMGVPASVIRVEGESKNTVENAIVVQRMMTYTGWRSILLVTSAAHMRRALWLFDCTNIKVIPAPTDFEVLYPPFTLTRILPDAHALKRCTEAVKEYVGLWVYKLTMPDLSR